MSEKKYKAVIFDMDGVILDSEYIYLKSLQKCLRALLYKEIPIDELSCVIGKNNYDITNYLLETYHINETFKNLSRLQNEYFDAEVEKIGIKEMDGLSNFLSYLKKIKCKIAVASSSDMKWILKVLKELRIYKYFDYIVSGDEVMHSKPNPEIFNIAVDRLGVQKYDIIIIEDSKNGIKAAKNAEIDVVAYKGSSIKQDTNEANYEVNSYDELKKMLKFQ